MDNGRYITPTEGFVVTEEEVKPKRVLKGRKNWMRNKPCTCGSGKKLKKCCWGKLAKTKVYERQKDEVF